MIRPTLEAETEELIAMAAGTGVFKPLELDVLRELLGDWHAGLTDDHIAITIERDGRPVGFAYYAPTPMTVGTWHLYWLFVDKAIHARGIGGELLRHVEADIAAAGGRVLLIETSGLPSYDLTRRFYAKHGYEEAATLRDFYCDGDDQVIFRKRLDTHP